MHLDQKDLIMFPMLKIITQAPPGINPVNQYWMINVNLKDERFEVMDSLRTLQDKEFMAAVKTIKDGITLHWETQYSVMIENWPLTDIDVPKQDNTDDCGVYMLQNASMWEAKLLPPYGPTQIPNIRKLQTHSFLKSGKNTQDWKGILKIK